MMLDFHFSLQVQYFETWEVAWQFRSGAVRALSFGMRENMDVICKTQFKQTRHNIPKIYPTVWNADKWTHKLMHSNFFLCWIMDFEVRGFRSAIALRQRSPDTLWFCPSRTVSCYFNHIATFSNEHWLLQSFQCKTSFRPRAARSIRNFHHHNKISKVERKALVLFIAYMKPARKI